MFFMFWGTKCIQQYVSNYKLELKYSIKINIMRALF